MERSEFYSSEPDSDEGTLYEAYLRHLQVARHLATTDVFKKEAYYLLLFSIECFFKDLLCLARYYAFGKGSGKTELEPKLIKTAITPRTYSHDIKTLTHFLTAILPELETSAFAALQAAVPGGSKWPGARYQKPLPDDPTEFGAKFVTLDAAFERVLSELFPGLR